MLVELGVTEQRYRAVLEVLEEGTPVVEVARRYGVARQTVHQWLARYANDGGLAGLADRSSRPGSCPHQMLPVVEARIVKLRTDHPGWGPSRIVWQLERESTGALPGRSSVYRALVRHGLIVPGKRRRRREDYRRWERGRSMELWQMDVMGRVHLPAVWRSRSSPASMTTPGSSSARRWWQRRRPGRCARRWRRRWPGMGSRSRS